MLLAAAVTGFLIGLSFYACAKGVTPILFLETDLTLLLERASLRWFSELFKNDISVIFFLLIVP